MQHFKKTTAWAGCDFNETDAVLDELLDDFMKDFADDLRAFLIGRRFTLVHIRKAKRGVYWFIELSIKYTNGKTYLNYAIPVCRVDAFDDPLERLSFLPAVSENAHDYQYARGTRVKLPNLAQFFNKQLVQVDAHT